MSGFLKDRCSMICGERGSDCITTNNKQVRCVADMVVNQAYGILSVVDMYKSEKDKNTAAGYLEEVRTISNELINWAKYLQVTHDIRKAVQQKQHWKGNSRGEARYPFPEEFREYISLRVDGPIDPTEATIVNFSQSGLRFMYKGAEPQDCLLACTLTSNERIGKSVSLVCEVKYFADHDGEMLIGAEIVEISDSPDFNFFMSVLDMMSEAASRDIQAA